MPLTSLTSYFNSSSFGDRNSYTRNQQELAFTLDSAAHELANLKTLISMTAGGAAFECGGLLATTFLSSVAPSLCAIPLLTRALTFGVSALADSGATHLMNQCLKNGGGEESFWEQFRSQSSVRLMGMLAVGQCFAVVNLMQGLTTLCQEKSQKGSGGLLSQMIMGIQCHVGSGAFSYWTGNVVHSVQERVRIRSQNMLVGTPQTGSLPRNLRETISGGLEKLSNRWSPHLQANPRGIQEPMRAKMNDKGGNSPRSASVPKPPTQIQLTPTKTLGPQAFFEAAQAVAHLETAAERYVAFHQSVHAPRLEGAKEPTVIVTDWMKRLTGVALKNKDRDAFVVLHHAFYLLKEGMAATSPREAVAAPATPTSPTPPVQKEIHPGPSLPIARPREASHSHLARDYDQLVAEAHALLSPLLENWDQIMGAKQHDYLRDQLNRLQRSFATKAKVAEQIRSLLSLEEMRKSTLHIPLIQHLRLVLSDIDLNFHLRNRV